MACYTYQYMAVIQFTIITLQCLDSVDLFRIVDANTSIGLQSADLERASVVLLYHFENGFCKPPETIYANYTYVDYLVDVMTSSPTAESPTTMTSFWGRRYRPVDKRSLLPPEMGFSNEQLNNLLDVIKSRYKPKSANKVGQFT